MLTVSKFNTKVSVKSIGEVDLKFISLDDIITINNIVKEKEIGDKEKTVKILYNQLLSPKTSYEEFLLLPEEDLITIATEFIKKEKSAFECYCDNGNFYADFNLAFKKMFERQGEEIKKTLESINGTLQSFSASIASIALPDYGSIAGVFKVETGIAETMRMFSEHMASVVIPDHGGIANVLKAKMEGVAETMEGVKSSLAIMANINLKPMIEFAPNTLNSFWNDYLSLNGKINTNMFSLITSKELFPNIDYTKELLASSQIMRQNSEVFAHRITELEIYPPTAKSYIYRKVGITRDEIENQLLRIKASIENNSFLIFWKSKEKGKLYPNPERIAQGHVMGLLDVSLPEKLVIVDQQIKAGAGIIDIILTFHNGHGLERIILELKVFEEGHPLNDGIEQTFSYMETKRTDKGFRMIFDASKSGIVANPQQRGNKILQDIIININPVTPSSLFRIK
jgi:hypothetical protein